MTEQRLVRCMHTLNPHSGGLANVHFLEGISDTELLSSAEFFFAGDDTCDNTQVFVAGDGKHFVAESFNPDGKRIQFCGLGALAAAHVVFDQFAAETEDETVLEFSNAEQNWQARLASTDSANDVCEITLTYSKPSPVECAVPEFTEAILGVEPMAAATVGGDSSYLVLELADSSALKALQPDFGALIAATQRALIVTAKSKDADGFSDAVGRSCAIVFRYFAPQYGSPEDTATGSAAVQLAAYWSSRLQRKRFSALQLSVKGAWLQLGCDVDSVDLTARVEYR
ncbi:MAG: PhzF family phenazine biosynthesis protein [Gammaproteobacteria bacterium]|nr:PhzF family phenazine biosynthesis protein [Gammaproteobacteria bacterium]